MPGASSSSAPAPAAQAGQGAGQGAGPAAEAFVATGSNSYRLQAPLQFATVAHLRARGLALIDAAGEELTLDLSSVPAVDSAGLALLIEWLARARAASKRLRYRQPPATLLALARLSDVEALLTG